MKMSSNDAEHLVGEHHTLLRHYGQTQARCSELVRAQAAEIHRLQAQAMRLRAAVIVRETALAWAAAQRAEWEAAIPGLPRRIALARRVEALLARIQDLMRERWHWQRRSRDEAKDSSLPALNVTAAQEQVRLPVTLPEKFEDLAALEDSLVAADLVICQTGCLSHGAYWRVQDHCKRTGKACMLVEQPDAVRIVRIHQPPLKAGTDVPPLPESTSP